MLKNILGITLLVCSFNASASLIDQTGNLLDNGSFELGGGTVVGHSVQSATNNWRQWSNNRDGNSGRFPVTTSLISNDDMIDNYGSHVIDGDSAFYVSALGGWSGAYTFNSYSSGSWDPYQELTFSAWVYTIEGTMGIFNGSNRNNFFSSQSTKIGEWEFLSLTVDAGRLNNEPLLYSVGGAAEFIVDSAWLNYGSTVENPSAVPEPSIFGLMSLGLLGLGFVHKKRKV